MVSNDKKDPFEIHFLDAQLAGFMLKTNAAKPFLLG
jgi:hypothetical protein